MAQLTATTTTTTTRLAITLSLPTLPPSRFLWPILNPLLPFSQLITQVVSILPPDQRGHGPEDFVAEVEDGLECLHFRAVGEVRGDMEGVIIRRLREDEIIVRQTIGRILDGNDGIPIIDGVPFGEVAELPAWRAQEALEGPGESIVERGRGKTRRITEGDEERPGKKRKVEGPGDGREGGRQEGEDEGPEEMSSREMKVAGVDRETREGKETKGPRKDKHVVVISLDEDSSDSSSEGSLEESSLDDEKEDEDKDEAGSSHNDSSLDLDTSSSSDSDSDSSSLSSDDSDSEPNKNPSPVKPLTKTQRRNARRRKALKSRRASLSTDMPDPTAAVTATTTLISVTATPARQKEPQQKQQERADVATVTKTPVAGTDEFERLRSQLLQRLAGIETETSTEIPKSEAEHSHESTEPNGKPTAADYSSWGEKINLSAVECVSDMTLPEPPFPFVQRWYKKNKGETKGRQSQQSQVERRRAAEPVTEGLPYDDGDIVGWMNGEWGGGQHGEGDEAHEKEEKEEEEEDLPIPLDLSALPILSFSDLTPPTPTTAILFSKLHVSAATNWTPTISTMTARVLEVLPGSQQVVVQLARRFRRKKVFDEAGERVYGGFEGPDEEADEGIEVVGWRELGVVRGLPVKEEERAEE